MSQAYQLVYCLKPIFWLRSEQVRVLAPVPILKLELSALLFESTAGLHWKDFDSACEMFQHAILISRYPVLVFLQLLHVSNKISISSLIKAGLADHDQSLLSSRVLGSTYMQKTQETHHTHQAYGSTLTSKNDPFSLRLVVSDAEDD